MRQPNFLLFITDQHRADHLGCYGNTVVSTPHIDSLANEGRVFDNFHVATPICQPNRASLMTSRMPSAHGVQMNGRELSFGETTFVEMLRDAGYRTALVGKSHLQNITAVAPPWPGPQERRRPYDARRRFPGVYGQEVWKRWDDDPSFELTLPYYGFERVRITIGHADEQHGHWRRWLRAQTPEAERLIGPDNAIPTPGFRLTQSRQAWRTRLPEELYPSAFIAQEANALLAEYACGERPFFLQCSFPDPHHPFTPPGRYWDMYRPSDMALPPSWDATLHDAPPPVAALRAAAAAGQARKSGHSAFACDAQEAREAMALNYGNVSCIDDAIGQVLAQLRKLALDDNTVVIFTSDHGELLGDHGLLLKGGLHYRALTRVPFVWRDTAGQRQALRSPELAQTTDVGVTVLDRAGLPPANGMHGRSLLDIARDASPPGRREHLVIEEEGQRRDFGLAQRVRMRSLLTAQHRLTIYDGQGWGECYDLAADPDELRNLWLLPEARGLRAELGLQLARAMLETADTSPYPNASA